MMGVGGKNPSASMLVIVAKVMVALAIIQPALADPMQPWDNFVSPCPGGFLTDPPPSPGYRLWSAPATWPNNVVPGVGAAAGANVSIPCGTAVLLDVPLVNLTILNIRGLLRVQDTPSLPSITIHAAFIIVEGQLHAGTPSQHFSQRLTFNLVPNPANRANFGFTANPPADPLNARGFGHKAFVVVGGQLRLYGMPGGRSTLAYTKLSQHVSQNDLFFFVEGDVTAWPDDAQIVVASTDFGAIDQNEVFTILEKTLMPGGLTTKISVNQSFRYDHFGDAKGVPDGFGGFVDERAEVALLARNIVITGTDEPAPDNFHGGHFMIFHTATPQFIEGVNFWRLGQQGTLGRYSIHFHLSGNQEGTLLRRNLILDSKQRCVVIHATFNLTVEENVAFNNFGHCYLVEEGGEVNNTFLRNLGIRSKRAELIIPSPPNAEAMESDGSASTFWISNPRNNYIGNIAVSADNAGYWFELSSRVRGNTLTFPPWNNTVPNSLPQGIFKDNVAHSCRGVGLRYYPRGYRPRLNRFVTGTPPGLSNSPVNATNEGMVIWKHAGTGMFIHNSDQISIVNGTFADNRYGINIDANMDISIVGSRFIGQSPNLGNPWGCNSVPSTCGPVAPSCNFPISGNEIGRSQGFNHWRNLLLGIIMDQTGMGDQGNDPHTIADCKFSNYDPTCRPAAGIGVGINAAAKFYWTTAHWISGIQVAPGTVPVYFPAQSYTHGDGGQFYGGEAATQYTFFDRDGSVTGGSRGFVVANNPSILPPQNRLPCIFQPNWNAYSCPNVCYRTVMVTYIEEGFRNATAGMETTRNRREASFLSVKRIEDGRVLIAEGNLRHTRDMVAPLRVFALNLAAGTTYELNIGLPANNTRFVPANITFQYRDGGGCGQGITFRIPGVRQQWIVQDQTSSIGWSSCPGVRTSAPIQYSYVCHKSKSTLQIRFAGNLTSSSPITIFRSTSSTPPCQLSLRCTVLPSNSFWAYNTSGAELHAFYPGGPAFSNPLFDATNWLIGRGPIGAIGWNWNAIATWTARPNPTAGIATFYFRSTFNIINSRCITGLWVDVFVDDGAVVYLNGIEILRPNMPAGNISTITRAVSGQSLPTRLYTTFFIPVDSSFPSFFTEGTNYLAAETHVAGNNMDMVFDLRAWVQMSSGTCRGATQSAEVCDGIDNDGDGTVDIDAATGQPFHRPCSTSCGMGVETCIRGAFQNCTAPPSFPEICNGIDDDCDGMIDDGPGQLDCPSGLTCYRGRCLQRTSMILPVNTVPRNSSWLYFDSGGTLYQSYPNWTNANLPLRLFKSGKAPFTTSATEVASNGGTLISSLAGTNWISQFFLLPFNLTVQQASNTASISLNVRRDDGAIIFINGVEIWRTNMPAGNWTRTTPALGTWGTAKTSYFANTPFRNTSFSLQAGLNWLAVDLRQSSVGNGDSAFDMDLTRNTIVSCSSLPGAPSSCVRQHLLDYSLIPAGSVWKYLDASMPLPSFEWTKLAFDDSQWKSGQAPLGFNANVQWIRTNITTGVVANNSRITYFFRQLINVADGNCFFNLTFSQYAVDGVVVYVNGAELYRFNMPSGPSFPNPNTPIFPTTFALGNPWWNWRPSLSFAGGYLLPGDNVIAVEVHANQNNQGYTFFDFNLVGQREGVNCAIPPI